MVNLPMSDLPQLTEEFGSPRLNKIKLNSKKCLIEYETYLSDDWYDRKILGPASKVTDNFSEAFDALTPTILRICEVADCWAAENITPIGLALSYLDGTINGVVMTALYQLDNSNSPLVINTPHHVFSSEQDDAKGVLTHDDYLVIQKLLEQAEAYLGGVRRPEPVQGDLFDYEPEKTRSNNF
jgi:hypothetical protein